MPLWILLRSKTLIHKREMNLEIIIKLFLVAKNTRIEINALY